MRTPIFLIASALLAATHAAAAELPPGIAPGDRDRATFRLDPERDPLRSFEDDSEGWLCKTPDPNSSEAAPISSLRASHGSNSVELRYEFPARSAVFKRASIGPFRYLSYDVYIPEGATGRVRSAFFVKDKDGLWFQAVSRRPFVRAEDGSLVPGRSASRLEPGRWNTVAVDLRAETSDLRPVGHSARWQERFAPGIEVIGFAVFGDEPQSGAAHLDNLRGWLVKGDQGGGLAIRNLRLPAGRIGTFEPWEATFELSRHFENPFDPAQVEVEAVVTSPGGRESRVPGFFFQDYSRSLTPEGEELAPRGPGVWKVRHAPEEPGPHRFKILARTPSNDGNDIAATGEMTFTVFESGHPGFIKVSERDPRCFETTRGEPFYPIGHNLRSPTDERCSRALGFDLRDDLGTFAYDRYFERMAAAGENFVEVWMSSWWLAIEWNAEWKDFHGLGRYSMSNAWRLDHLLGRARELGLRVHLVVDNHGKYSSWCDAEWRYSPFNIANRSSGGFLRRPEEFFEDGRAKDFYRRKARYIAARWGWDPTIAGIEMVSELNLTGSRGNQIGRRQGQDGPDAPLRSEHLWHEEMIRHFRESGAGRHVFTTHYSGDYKSIDPVMARLGEIDYVVGDAYRSGGRPFVDLALASSALAEYGKPYLITEFGGDWSGASAAGLEADLHCGLWGGYMTPAAGTPLMWWFDFIDVEDHYGRFRALAEFARGEDRRDPELATRIPQVAAPPGSPALAAISYASMARGYAWVYAVEPMKQYPRSPVMVEGASVRLEPVRDGRWLVETWDTTQGRPIGSGFADAEGGTLKVDLPTFANDIALKFELASP